MHENNKENFSLIKYDENSKEQNIFLKEIANDDEVIKYLNNVTYSIIDSENSDGIKGFLIKDETIDKYIGICTFVTINYDIHSVTVEYAIHKKYRSSGQRYGRRVLQNLVNYLFSTNNYSKIVLEISSTNIASIKSAAYAGFEIDHDLSLKFQQEDYRNVPYSFYNKNYKYCDEENKIVIK